MARIRTIKPSFFQSDDVSALPMRARLTWIGLWTQCDDAGRTKDHTRLIKAAIWPLDQVSLADIEQDLETLAAHGRIVRYEVGGQRYLEVVNWDEHQKIQKKTPSRIPPPPADSRTAPVGLPEGSGSPIAGKGKEGKGKEGTRAREEPPTHLADPFAIVASVGHQGLQEGPADDVDRTPSAEVPQRGAAGSVGPTTARSTTPPHQRCPRHADDPNPPNCGRCADARRQHETWKANRPAPNRIDPRPDYDTIAAEAVRGQQRSHRAAAAAAQIRRPAPASGRTDPVAAARERGTSLDALDALTAGMAPLTEPPPDEPDPPLADVVPIRSAEEP